MKTILLLLFCSSIYAQYTNIPDSNFERKLIAMGLDTAIDGKIQTDSISSLKVLDVSESAIKDLSGISAFKELKELICFNNQLTSLDISQNLQLTKLDCSLNNISILKATENKALATLDCSGNRISRLELFNNPNLEKLDCSGNKLSYLDMKNCHGLLSMDASNNLLREVDLRNYNKGFSSNMGMIDLRINRRGIKVRIEKIPAQYIYCDQDYVCVSY